MILLALTGFALFAQQVDIRTTVPLVVTPVSVTDKNGKPVAGLREADFLVYDGAKLSPHKLETSAQSISVVVCIQSNTGAGPALAKLAKVGALIMPLIVGEYGAAAILTFSDKATLRQEFTSNADEITKVFAKLRPDGDVSRTLDAVDEGLRMLDRRPRSHRKVMILIGESKDRGSEAKLEDVLQHATASNVTIYPIKYSSTFTAYTSRGAERFGDKKDPDHDKEPRVYQAQDMNLFAAFGALGRLGMKSTVEALSKSTGGTVFSFLRLKGLEEMVQRVSADLHNQYVLTFTPGEGVAGYRELRVDVKDQPGLVVRARSGFWAEAK